MNKQYETLLMDIDGTLLDFNRAEEEAFKALLKIYGMEPLTQYAEEYHQINKSCWQAFEEGRMKRDEVLTSRFDTFFKSHGLAVDGREAEEQYRIFLEQGAYLIEGALDICEYLKKSYRMCVVTNGIARTQHIRLRACGLTPFFEKIFISEEVGSQKPQKAFFDYCLSRIEGARREKMLIIGDSLTSDIQGGVNAGIDACWFNPEKEVNYRHLPVTFEIKSLHELRELL